jgi:uncharacterized NAD(P)/FAD-binding protein YdhS
VHNITIIGAGLSGMLLSMQLLKQSAGGRQLTVTLIDRYPEDQMGAAYSTNEDCLLLNVPACRMSAFEDHPSHFLNWVNENGTVTGPWNFLPRKLYRKYIHELLTQAQNENPQTTLIRICGEATDILLSNGNAVVMLDEKAIGTDKVVLAPGNFLPRDLPIPNMDFNNSGFYFRDPWRDDFFSSIPSNAEVVLIGTGQTTVDILQRFHVRKHTGKITAISRHGWLPLSHSSFNPYPSFYDEIIGLSTITDVLRCVRKHTTNSTSKGMDVREVIDSMRPYTQELWIKLPLTEKSRFLRHLFRHFEIVRSRIPPENMAVVYAMQQSRQLKIVKGRITNMEAKHLHAEIHYANGTDGKENITTATVVINATGPELDYTRVDQPLIRNLLHSGLIQQHQMGLGINVHPNGAIICNNETAGNILFTIGSAMRGVLWEVIAVPEIRVQASQLATLLLRDLN